MSGRFRVGVSREAITPPVGSDLTGYGFRDRPSDGIHDNLYAKALVLDDGKERAAIVTCDLLALGRGSVRRIRNLAEKETGINRDHMMISCTHNHSGPATIPLLRCGRINREWLRGAERKIARGISRAFKNMKAAKFGAGKGKIDGLSINRRAVDSKGKAPFINIMNYSGAVDNELGVLRFDTLAGRPMAALTNFSCHPIVFPDEENAYSVSADFPGEVQRIIESQRNVVALYSNGAAGNINPTSACEGPEAMRRVGRAFAREALRVFDRVRTTSEVKIKVASEVIRLKYKHIPALNEMERMLKEAMKKYEHIKRSNIPVSFTEFFEAAATVEWAGRTLRLIRSGRAADYVKMELQVLMFDNVILVAIPGEVFTEIGLSIKEATPSYSTFVIGYANGHAGYIPTSAAYREGGYEVQRAFRHLGHPAGFEPNVDEVIEHTVSEMIRRIG